MDQTRRIDDTSVGAARIKTRHINDVQTATVDEHFELLMKDDTPIDPEHSNLGPEDLPDWFDEELFRAGQGYYRRNLLSMGLTALIGVLAVIVVPSILKVLVYTKQSGTICTAYKRYLETVLHIYALYTSDISDKDSDWWKSLNTIRWKHSMSSRRSSKADAGAITHRDMAITQFGFIGYALVRTADLGLTDDPEGHEGLCHFWRVVGHALGISERLNICRKNTEETTRLCEKLLEEVYVKNMKDTPPNFEHMSSVLIDGLWSIDPSLDVDAFMHLWYRLSGLEYPKPMGTYSWLNTQYRRSVLSLLRVPYIGQVVRSGFNVYVRLIYWIAENYPVVAWIRHGKAQSAINLYPKLTKSQ